MYFLNKSQVSNPKSQIPRRFITWDLVLGAWDLGLEVWNLGLFFASFVQYLIIAATA